MTSSNRFVPPLEELSRRAASVRVVLTDCDRVLTDGGVYLSERGEEIRRFSARDGTAVEWLAELGIATAIVTAERSPCIARRADKLGARAFLGVRDKTTALASVLGELDVHLDEVAFIGCRASDVDLIVRVNRAGLTGAPADAPNDVKQRVHEHTRSPGGGGAFDEFATWILQLSTRVGLQAGRTVAEA